MPLAAITDPTFTLQRKVAGQTDPMFQVLDQLGNQLFQISSIGQLTAPGSGLPQSTLSLSVAGNSNVTLTIAQSGNPNLIFTGALTGNIQVILPTTPAAGSSWEVSNLTTGAFTLTFIAQTGTGIVITQGQRQDVFFDGTNMQSAITDAPTLAIGNGSAINQILVLSASLTPVAVAANTSAEQTFNPTAFAGLTTGHRVFVTKPTAQAGLGIVGCRVSAAGTLAITYGNFTGAPITPTAAETYLVFAIK